MNGALDMGNWRRVAQVSFKDFMAEVNQELSTDISACMNKWKEMSNPKRQ